MAPGVHIASTYKDNEYVYLDGTSMATPFVTGLVGLIVSLAIRSGRQLPVDDIYSIIRDTAQPMGDSRFYGAGLIDTKAALEEARHRIG
jgi:subtilisin family serine protease